jgi:putative transposase
VPRPPREFAAGGTYHVFSRGSNRQAIFRFDTDRDDFLMCLHRVVVRYELECLAYCLMPNHFHLVLETPDDRLSNAMKALNGRYSLRSTSDTRAKRTCSRTASEPLRSGPMRS